MKKNLLILTFLMTCSTQVFAYNWYRVNANCTINRSQVECSVKNTKSFPVYCELSSQAMTRSGINGRNFANGWVQPYSGYMYVYINANNPYNDPLVRANAQARCRF